MPSQSEGVGLASDLTHAVSLSDANTSRVTVRPGYPKPVQPVGRRGRRGERIPPEYGRLRLLEAFTRCRPGTGIFRTLRSTLYGKQLPGPRHAFELLLPTLNELDSRPDNQILHGAGDQDLPGTGQGANPRRDVDG